MLTIQSFRITDLWFCFVHCSRLFDHQSKRKTELKSLRQFVSGQAHPGDSHRDELLQVEHIQRTFLLLHCCSKGDQCQSLSEMIHIIYETLQRSCISQFWRIWSSIYVSVIKIFFYDQPLEMEEVIEVASNKKTISDAWGKDDKIHSYIEGNYIYKLWLSYTLVDIFKYTISTLRYMSSRYLLKLSRKYFVEWIWICDSTAMTDCNKLQLYYQHHCLKFDNQYLLFYIIYIYIYIILIQLSIL